MCNNTSLSTFLEGVTFMDDNAAADPSCLMMMEELEQELLKDDCMLLLDEEDTELDSEMMMDVDDDMDNDSNEDASDLLYPLPPLEALLGAGVEGDDEITALFSDSAKSDKKLKDIPSALEDLAQSMRQSEMALKEHSSKLRKAEHAKIFAKYQDFFTGGRMTITPELEQSRQKVWTMIRQQTKKTTTAAAS